MNKAGRIVRGLCGFAVAVSLPVSIVWAEEASKPIPTLLIKGEVLSFDTHDPSATVLTVKDRYGFETPILVSPETKIKRGDQVMGASDVTSGANVEVEYTFDINTAKRHAISVAVVIPQATVASQPAQPQPASAAATVTTHAPAAEMPTMPTPSPAESAPTATPPIVAPSPAPVQPQTNTAATPTSAGQSNTR